MTKRKIGLVIPSLGPGGMERVMSILANFFDRKDGTEVHLILYGRQREIFYSIPESIIVHKPTFRFDNSKRTWHTIKTLYFLRTRIKSIQPNTLLSFGEFWNNFFLLATLGLKIPKYVSDRAEPGLKKSWHQNLLCRWLYPFADSVIVQTELAKEIYKKKFKYVDIKVIGNPIKKVSSDIKLEQEKAILSVGRLVDTKHFDLLIKIFHTLNTKEWKLYIVGGDSQKQDNMNKLRKLVSDLGIEDRVILTGTVSNVDEYYRRSKIFAFTSSSEGFPNVIGEAMSAGLPIISFDCVAGPSELIEDGKNGFLIPLFDKYEFKEKLSLLMNDHKLQEEMGEKSKEKVEQFSVDVIAEKYYSLINSR